MIQRCLKALPHPSQKVILTSNKSAGKSAGTWLARHHSRKEALHDVSRNAIIEGHAVVNAPCDCGRPSDNTQWEQQHMRAMVSLPLTFLAALMLYPEHSCAEAVPVTSEEVTVQAPGELAAAKISITVSLANGVDPSPLGPSPTLFLTAKPAAYKLPYASRKVVIPLGASGVLSFPTEVLIGRRDELMVPPEQYAALSKILDGSDVEISARLDKDGDANTRDAEDLVGRGFATWDASTKTRKPATLVLEERGFFAKFVTDRSKK